MMNVKIISFDLGSQLGYNRSTIEFKDKLIKLSVQEHKTVDLTKLANDTFRRERPPYSMVRIKRNIFRERVTRILKSGNFDVIAVEDVYCNPAMLSAYHSLVIYREILEDIANNLFYKSVTRVPVRSIKRVVSGKGDADKTLMINSIYNHPDVTLRQNTLLDEHMADSIGVSLTFAKIQFAPI